MTPRRISAGRQGLAVACGVLAGGLSLVALPMLVYWVCVALAILDPTPGYGSPETAADMMMMVLAPLYMPLVAVAAVLCGAAGYVLAVRRLERRPKADGLTPT